VLIGYWENNHLASVLATGSSLHPVNARPEALDAFSQCIESRRCASIVGVRDEAIGLWERLCVQNSTQWASPREVRDRQKVMAVFGQPLIAPDPRVQVMSTSYLGEYHAASVAMYTEEVGVAPLYPQGSYRDHVASLMMKGHAFGVVAGGRVVFKADIVAADGEFCQVGGVWLAPDLRTKGLSESLMAGVVAHCRQRGLTPSLYVNPFNSAALRCYEAVGFTQVGECATVMY